MLPTSLPTIGIAGKMDDREHLDAVRLYPEEDGIGKSFQQGGGPGETGRGSQKPHSGFAGRARERPLQDRATRCCTSEPTVESPAPLAVRPKAEGGSS